MSIPSEPNELRKLRNDVRRELASIGDLRPGSLVGRYRAVSRTATAPLPARLGGDRAAHFAASNGNLVVVACPLRAGSRDEEGAS